jgi:periplasmic protein CpxP/Spy
LAAPWDGLSQTDVGGSKPVCVSRQRKAASNFVGEGVEQVIPEVKTRIVDEVQRFAAELNLSEAQRTQLHTAIEKAEDRIEQIRKQNPDVTRADVIKKLIAARDQIREHVVKFLTPEQLTKWDAQMAKAKEFLGVPMKA